MPLLSWGAERSGCVPLGLSTGEASPSHFAVEALSKVALEALGLLCWESTLLACGQLGGHQVPRGFLCQAAPQSASTGLLFPKHRAWRFP